MIDLKQLINDKVFEIFGADDIGDLATSIIERLEDEDINAKEFPSDALFQAMDDEMIYYDDQWEMIKYYCLPKDADFDKAWEDFYDDICDVLNRVREELGIE